MFCPRCATTAIEGQRFCRSCGMNLGVILDAIEGKRGPIDFETLKRDLRDLGANLRSGFEGAGNAIKRTARLDSPGAGGVAPADSLRVQEPAPPAIGSSSKGKRKGSRTARTRTESLQRAVESLLGGGALLGVWAFLLRQAYGTGLLESIARMITQESGYFIQGLPEVLRSLWVLALIPISQGIGHLINGIFFAPKPPQPVESTPVHLLPLDPPSLPVAERVPPSAVSVTEDSTLRLLKNEETR